MKKRLGFVSNSSSSSFCIIGIDNPEKIKTLMKKDEFPFIMEKERPSRYDFKKRRYLTKKEYLQLKENSNFVEVLDLSKIGGGMGIWETSDRKKNKSKLLYLGGESFPEYVGLDAEKLLQNKNIKEAKKYLVKYIKDNYQEDIAEKDIHLLYGEVSS